MQFETVFVVVTVATLSLGGLVFIAAAVDWVAARRRSNRLRRRTRRPRHYIGK